jgi:hypothetical protein
MQALALLNILTHQGTLRKNRIKDIHTSIQKLADAFDVPLEDLDLTKVEATYEDKLKQFFAQMDPPPSVYTQRNTRQNLRQLYRALRSADLITTPPTPRHKPLTAHQIRDHRRQHSPYRSRSIGELSIYRVPPEQWPGDILERWERFVADRSLSVKPVTITNYTHSLFSYISYGIRFDRTSIACYDDLFDRARLTRYVTWHANRVGASRITSQGKNVVRNVVMMARYEQHPALDTLFQLYKKLPFVAPFHDKQAACHAVTAEELEQLGLEVLEHARRPCEFQPPDTKRKKKVVSVGLSRSVTCANALILRLMWRLPLRSRCVREMALGTNLFQDEQGIWRLRYAGEQLKVSHRGGRINRFEVPWPPDLVDHLEEYLHDFRPRFHNADTNPLVFLTRFGHQLTPQVLGYRISQMVYARLGKRLYPHLLRTLWVDRYLLESNGDISTAAYILNDNVQTVLKRYHELRGFDHIKKAYEFNTAMAKKATTP